jgi:assimilatory nitrate reductase catalytic subunit
VRRNGAELLPVAGDNEHPGNRGRLCVKGSALHETVGTQRRLLYPSIAGQRVGWTQVLDTIAERIRNTVSEFGPQSVALYLSGQLLTEDYYVANKLWKGFVGSANVDTNSRLCMSSAVAAQQRAFGEDVVPGCYEDLEIADLVILVGSNSAWAHPVLHQRLLNARKQRPNMKLVVIDPRRTASCDQADLHLPLKPGGDAFLFNGLLVYLAEHNALDRAYIKQHTNNFDDTLAAARAITADVASVAEQCELSVEVVEKFYRWFAQTPRTVTLFSQGINQSSSGTDKGNAIINCHLATARVGKPGASPFSITGQPNAMGGREVGGLANQLAVHRGFNDESIEAVANFWQAPNIARTPGLKAVPLFEAIERGEVKFLWILATNPLVSMPESERWKRALAKCETVIVSDCVQDTDTTQLANILLPAAGWGEKDGTVTNSERCISRQRAFLPLAGEARADWWALSEVGKRLGFDSAFSYGSAGDIFVEYAALSGINRDTPLQFDISGLASLDKNAYDALQPLQWPVPSPTVNTETDSQINASLINSTRVYGDGLFSSADRRACFIAVEPQWPQSDIERNAPLRLNTGRVRDQWHTMTRTAESERLNRHRSEPFVEVHPQDAAVFGLANGEIAEIHNKHGKAWLRVRIEPNQRRGSLFAPIHWNDQFAARATVDVLVPAITDPHSGQPELKHASVAVRPLPTRWRATLICRNAPQLTRDFYWSRVPINGGWLYWLAGDSEFAAAQEMLTAALLANKDPLSGASLSEQPTMQFIAEDLGEMRAAWIDNDNLQAILIMGRSDLLPDPWWLASQLAQPIAEADRRVLLSGRAAGEQSAQGAMICSCFQVSETQIRTAIGAGCRDSAALGAQLRCGTNCGSCIPELNRLIKESANTSSKTKASVEQPEPLPLIAKA